MSARLRRLYNALMMDRTSGFQETARALAAAGIVLGSLVGAAAAQENFYTAKVVTLHIGYDVGGGYDVAGRVVARHLGTHLPGQPTIVVKNMPGAGSMRLANYLYSAAPRDGTEIGAVGREIPIASLLGTEAARFKSDEFGWIGSISKEGAVCVASNLSPVKSAEDLFKNKLEFIVGGTTGESLTVGLPHILNNLAITNIKVIPGYPGTDAILLAMERGEVHGLCYMTLSTLRTKHSHALQEGRVKILLEISLETKSSRPDVPLITDYIKGEEGLQILKVHLASTQWVRPFVAPPGLPPERLAQLRAAFKKMTDDPEFKKDVERMKLDLDALDGAEMAGMIRDLNRIPRSVVNAAVEATQKK